MSVIRVRELTEKPLAKGVILVQIMVVEDEKRLALSLQEWLELEGNVVKLAFTAESALALSEQEAFDVIIVDLLLPCKSGVDFCRLYRAAGGAARILVLTAKVNIQDKENAFNAGADDYLNKPFDLKEVSIRIKALMRRSITVVGAELKVLDLRLDCSNHRVMRGTNEVVLSPQEFALLEFLMRNEQKIFSADDLIKKVWRGDASNATVRTHIKTLRKKVDANELVPLLQTIHGVGYCISQTSFDH